MSSGQTPRVDAKARAKARRMSPVRMKGQPRQLASLDRTEALMAEGADHLRIAAELGIAERTAYQYMVKVRMRADLHVAPHVRERLAAILTREPADAD